MSPARHCGVLLLSVLTASLLTGCRREPTSRVLNDGISALRKGRLDQAVALLTQAVEDQPSNATARCNLGIALWKAGDVKGAIPAFKEAAALAPADPQPLEFLGHIHGSLGQWVQASEALTEANRRAPQSPRVLTALASAQLYARGPSAAHNVLNRALTLAPDYPPAIYNMGVLCRDWLNNRPESQKYFQRYLKVAGHDPRADAVRQALGESTARTGRPQAPKQGGTSSTPAATKALSAARTAVLRKDYNLALAELKKASVLSPADPEPAWELATLHDRFLSDTSASVAAYRSFIQQFPGDFRVAEAQARVAFLTIQPQTGKESAQSRAAIRNAQEATEAYNLGVRHQTEENWTKAKAEYLRALQKNPALADAAYNLGLVCRSMGDRPQAKHAFLQALGINPGMVNARYMLAVVHQELNENAQAIAHLNELLSTKPNHAEYHLALGLVYSKDAATMEQAKQEFTRYLELAPAGSSAAQVRNWLKRNP